MLHNSVFIKTTIIILFSLFGLIENAFARNNSDYPKDRNERLMDKMDSAVGNKSFIFSPEKAKNDATKTKGYAINQYLWRASLDVINFAPILSTDSNSGTIITDWYSPKPNQQLKINVVIKSDLITPEGIDVRVFERNLVNGNWIDKNEQSPLSTSLEDQILRKARDLYIESKK